MLPPRLLMYIHVFGVGSCVHWWLGGAVMLNLRLILEGVVRPTLKVSNVNIYILQGLGPVDCRKGRPVPFASFLSKSSYS